MSYEPTGNEYCIEQTLRHDSNLQFIAQVSVHLVFPAGRPPALGEPIRTQGDCAASDLQKGEEETERKQRDMIYPINVARNVARSQANTSRVLVTDIELLPSDKLASGFVEMVRRRQPKTGVVFVVPVFEIESNEKPPSTKKELLLATKAGTAVYFHRFVWINKKSTRRILQGVPRLGCANSFYETKRQKTLCK